MSARNTVFVHTNPKQMLAARVAAYALGRNARDASRFDVRIIDTSDFPILGSKEGQSFLRAGAREIWRNDDLQSFTPLRFAVPALMQYSGRALVIDPDVFAVGDVDELFQRNPNGAAILARPLAAEGGRTPRFASSVMLLDCARLRHWHLDSDFGQLFDGQRDYRPWIELQLEPPGSVGPLEAEWNDFDRLTPETRLLHNTRRGTQPWKTGLPVDFVKHEVQPRSRLMAWWGRLTGRGPEEGRKVYRPHPDPAQERMFFALLAECLDRQIVTRAMLEGAIASGELRPDAFEVLDRARAKVPGAAPVTA